MKYLSALLVVLFLAGCGPSEAEMTATANMALAETQTAAPTNTPTATATLTPTPTFTPTLTPTPTETPVILYQDDFSDPEANWNLSKGRTGLVNAADGAFSIIGNVEGTLFWRELKNQSFSDIAVEVDAVFVNTYSGTGAMGVSCRDHYDFVINIEGAAFIFRDTEAGLELLRSKEIATTSATLNKAETNRIRAICDGNLLALYLNGDLVLQTTDNRYSEGKIYLGASQAEIRFDNFHVTVP